MKKYFFLGAMMIALSMSAHATLLDGFDGTGISGITGFDDTNATVAGNPDFSGVVTGTGGYSFLAKFDFQTIGIEDRLSVSFDVLGGVSNVSDVVNFSVMFTDLQWPGLPSEVLVGLTFLSEDPVGGEASLSTSTYGDDFLTLNFVNFAIVQEIGEVEMRLDTGPGTVVGTPIPEPTSVILLVMGVAGLAARRKMA